jgi:predicted PurR-regulated permease PerM
LYGIIDVDAFNKSIEDQLSMLNANPNVPQEWKESQLDALINMTPIKSSILNFFRSVIFGAILSLIVSIFTRKKNNSFEGAIKEIE